MVEFALVSICFFLLVFGIFDCARLFESWITVQHAARTGARFAITGQDDCSGDGYSVTDNRDECIRQKAEAATKGLSRGGIDGSGIGVTFKSWDFPTYSTATSGSSGSQCDAIEVTVSYTHFFATPIIDAFAPSGISIAGKQRMTNEPFGPCT